MTVDNLPETSRKDLVHSIREIMFAIQIAESGRITNFAIANSLWAEVKAETSTNWNYYHEKYKPIWRQMHKRLKEVCPIDKENMKSETKIGFRLYNTES